VPVPEDAALGDPHRWFLAGLDQAGDRDAERVADARQRGEVRVGAALLQRHEDPFADPGARGEMVQ